MLLLLCSLFISFSAASQKYNAENCIVYTDEACTDEDAFCPASDRETMCSDQKCACSGVGECVGINERCFTTKYEQLPGTYRVQNAAFAGEFMHLPMTGGLKVGDDPGEESDFKIMSLPGSVLLVDKNDNTFEGWKQNYKILRNTKNLEYNTKYDASDFSGQGILLLSKKYWEWAAVVKDGDATVMKWKDASIDALGLWLWKAPSWAPQSPNASMVMLSGFTDPMGYIRLKDGMMGKSLGVKKHSQGAGSFWYITPPLPEAIWNRMFTYPGPKCKDGMMTECGEVEPPVTSSAMGCTVWRTALTVSSLLAWANFS